MPMRDERFADQPDQPDLSDRRAERQLKRAREARRLRLRRLTVTVTALALIVAGAVIVLRPDAVEPASTGSTAVLPKAPVTQAATPAAKSAAKASTATTTPAAATRAARKSSPSSAPTTPTEDLPVLAEGDYGTVIEVAQRALDVEPTGYFGPKTKAAVAEYQEAVGLPATGKVATFTWSTFGEETVALAVEASATPDGYVDAEPAQIQETPADETASASPRAARSAGKPPVLEETDSGEAVAVIQRALGVKPARGYFGPVTAKAVRQFQSDNGIPTTGVIATYTWAALGSDLAAEAATAHATYGTVFGPGVKSGGGGGGGGNNSGGGGNGGGAGGNGKGLFCPVANFSYGDGLGAPRPDGRTHAGLDLMGSRGEPIYAIASGTVTRSGYQSNGAMILDITGSQGMFFYGHFDSITVGYGDSVKAGQLIGYMGDTGSPGAVHLHLEVRPNGWSGGYDDPVPLIKSLCG